jgi:hypothetical protein
MLGKYISQKLDKGAMPGSDCLPCEDIAAFADDRLDRGNRKRVESHLADCCDCYRLYADTLAARAIVSGRADAPSGDRRVVKLLKYAIPGVLAAGIALLIFSGNFRNDITGSNTPSELKMPTVGPSLPLDAIGSKPGKPDGFQNISGHPKK